MVTCKTSVLSVSVYQISFNCHRRHFSWGYTVHWDWNLRLSFLWLLTSKGPWFYDRDFPFLKGSKTTHPPPHTHTIFVCVTVLLPWPYMFVVNQHRHLTCGAPCFLIFHENMPGHVEMLPCLETGEDWDRKGN